MCGAGPEQRTANEGCRVALVRRDRFGRLRGKYRKLEAFADGSSRMGAAIGPVPDGSHRLLLTEPGPRSEYLTEQVVPQRLADLGCQLDFAPSYRWPRAEPGPAPQALRSPCQQRLVPGRLRRTPAGRTRPGTGSHCG
jgi:hypothetical protein